MKGHKYSRTVLTILALSFGSASLQANPKNPLIGGTIPLTTFEPALGREVDYDQRHGAGDFNALLKWLTDIPKEIRDQLIKGQMSQEDFEAYEEMRVRDRWLQMSRTGKILFFNYCPTEMRLEFFTSLTKPEQVVALKECGIRDISFSECWARADHDVQEAAFISTTGTSGSYYTAKGQQEIDSMQPVEKFLSLAKKRIVSSKDVEIFVKTYEQLDEGDRAECFATFAKVCVNNYLGTEMIWKNFDRFSKDDNKICNFEVLVDCCKSGDDIEKIVSVYKNLGQASLFRILSDDVKKELFSPFFKQYKDDKDSATRAFIEQYKLDKDEEDLDFIDDLYDKEDSDD